ncbi:MAG: PilN domain-containing protein [Gemmatimonadota bacterium]|nr:PilN domain-containing protein [Gemmatimonadota bacterium]
MIEVNLLPGGKKGTASGGPLAGLASAFKGLRGGGSGGGGGGGSSVDPYMAFFAVAMSITIGYVVWAYLGVTGEREELEVRVEEERQDSVRFADLIERTNLLSARNDSIAERVSIIQEIDAGRYVWPHVLDEVAAAVPDYTWLREILYASGDPVQVRVNGRAGSIYAVTNFMRRLEASSYLRAVEMDRAEQVPSEENQDDLVYVFELLMTYEAPPFDEMETVPLFDSGTASTQTAAPAPGES